MSDEHESGIRIDMESSTYAEPDRDVVALFSNLQLNPAHYQRFSRRRPAKMTETAIEMPHPAQDRPSAIRVGVFSPMGGAGATTLVVSLGSILCEFGEQILLVDTSQWQSLVYHFGASKSHSGKRTFVAPGSRGLKIHILACEDGTFRFSTLDSLPVVAPLDCVLLDLGGLVGFLRTTRPVGLKVWPCWRNLPQTATQATRLSRRRHGMNELRNRVMCQLETFQPTRTAPRGQ
jgi:hypothetical protein